MAALAVLLAVPFARTMTRHPAAARAADQAAQAARAAAPGATSPRQAAPAAAAPAPDGQMEARIGELEASLAGLRSQLEEPPPDGPAPEGSRERRRWGRSSS